CCLAARGACAASRADAESRPAHGARERPRCARQRQSASPAPGGAGLVGGPQYQDRRCLGRRRCGSRQGRCSRAHPRIAGPHRDERACAEIEAGKATPAIPIVFVQVPDPVDLGIVASLARPGRNITGFTHFELAFAGKWLETLKDMAPQTRRVLLVTLAEHPALPGFLRTITALESS